jgi:putative oligomerization/nucleic acid binding protein
MLGFGSLEQKLREEGGRQAQATVLKAKQGIPTSMSEGSAMYGEDITRWHYLLRVEPEGEEPFEAKIVIRINHLDGLSLQEGEKAIVLYDPDDHRKVAFDVKATEGRRQAAWQQRTIEYEPPQPVAAAPSEGDKLDALGKLADLKQRGVLTEAEFDVEKAKILGS